MYVGSLRFSISEPPSRNPVGKLGLVWARPSFPTDGEDSRLGTSRFSQCPTHVRLQRTHIKGLCEDDYMFLPCHDHLGSKLAAHRSHEGAGTGTGDLYGGPNSKSSLNLMSEITMVPL